MGRFGNWLKEQFTDSSPKGQLNRVYRAKIEVITKSYELGNITIDQSVDMLQKAQDEYELVLKRLKITNQVMVTIIAGVVVAPAVAAAFKGTQLGRDLIKKDMLQNSGNGQELEGASGNPLANSTKGLKWTGIKQIGNKFFDAYGREILGKELDAILDKLKEQNANKPPKSGGTVFGGGSSVLNTQWQKLRIWVGNNWKILISVLVGAFVIWFFLFKRKSRTTARRRRLTSRPVRRSGQSRNPSKRSKQLAALAKGRRTRMRNLRAKKRK